MNHESWLPPYTPQEKSRELSMRSRILRRRAQRALYWSEKLRKRTAQLQETYGRLVCLLQGVGKRLEC
jgi:hypothetical protein